MVNIFEFNLDELKKWMKDTGEKPFRANQVFDWLYKGVYDFDEMKNISKSTIAKLKENFSVFLPKIVKKYTSKDGYTIKYLLSLEDGNIIEAVIMKYHFGNSICISTQIGCRMGCKFCASTIDGIVRNLASYEMLGEVITIQNDIDERISNIVLMGSGEPLDNYDNVLKFISAVTSEYTLNIGERHITLSTCGIVPKIYELADNNLQITLAISLHAYEDDRRKSIMPIANKYSIKEIIDACNYYIQKTNRRITFEYALIRNTNDSIQDAIGLGELLGGMLCHVNIIPINEIKENNYKKSNNKEIELFIKKLNSYNIEATIRREMGKDIEAACGQLRRSYIELN
ncbi:MAG: 23S rRNA (adenine(2503)-C(2))-methyltransferase RlmN [Clostridiaceae bacterium]